MNLADLESQSTPAGTPPGIGDGNVPGVPGACGQGNTFLPAGNSISNSTIGGPPNNTAAATAPPPLANTTTPQLRLPSFPGGSLSSSSVRVAHATSSAINGMAGTGKSGWGSKYNSSGGYHGRYGHYLRV